MNKKGNVPMQMVLVEIKREYKSIYNISNLFGLSVTAEPLKNKGFTIQCHRCQIFGHAQINCNAQFKCMKCGESHSTHLCAKPKTTPPKCANCQGEHTSIYKKCPVRPNILNTPEKITQKPENPWNKKQGKTTRKPQIENLTTKTDENPNNPNSKTKKISQILGNMLLEFCTLNPTDMQMQSFNKQILSIINKTIKLKTMQSRIPDSLPIKIMAWNANGIISIKLETDQYLIEQHIDIALISETHLRPGDKFKTPNYKTYRKDRDQNGRQDRPHLLATSQKRYSDEFKQFALTILFMSPMAYKFLLTTFMLPSIRTLQRFTSKIWIEPGIDETVFEMLRLKVLNLDAEARQCVICMDEMSLKANLYYDKYCQIEAFREDCLEEDFIYSQLTVIELLCPGPSTRTSQYLAQRGIENDYSNDISLTLIEQSIKDSQIIEENDVLPERLAVVEVENNIIRSPQPSPTPSVTLNNPLNPIHRLLRKMMFYQRLAVVEVENNIIRSPQPSPPSLPMILSQGVNDMQPSGSKVDVETNITPLPQPPTSIDPMSIITQSVTDALASGNLITRLRIGWRVERLMSQTKATSFHPPPSLTHFTIKEASAT
ncbi:hypothetical protein TcasGA2_TC010624 [Tribolium castaneum]|uniref:Pre-C2HC domain-containing protein n=1 Tax=Tribolium castaneum TaxID=7070 RepID=D7EJM8_TRICA|nr:hypothetical protein TcasGA2_TC010624 [Tribolium castaneum]